MSPLQSTTYNKRFSYRIKQNMAKTVIFFGHLTKIKKNHKEGKKKKFSIV